MKFNHLIYIILFSVIVITSCTKKEEPAPAADKKGNLTLKFDNVAGNSDFAFNTDYINASGNTFKVNMLRYFISNIRLTKADGSVYTIPQDNSYFLVDESIASSQQLLLKDIPEGDYTAATFIIGVDSLKSTKSNAFRLGALDTSGEAQGMYWSWNSGYIFFKMEGTSPAITSTGNAFRYHIGGFGGMTAAATNNIRTKTLTFGTDKSIVRQGKEPEVHLLMDILKVFNATAGATPAGQTFNFSTTEHSTIMSGANSSLVANNYLNAFTYDHVHN